MKNSNTKTTPVTETPFTRERLMLLEMILRIVFTCFQVGMILLFWNQLMPEAFGLTKITLLQAIELKLLCHALFPNKKSTNKKDREDTYAKIQENTKKMQETQKKMRR